jgi:hypothetical protein
MSTLGTSQSKTDSPAANAPFFIVGSGRCGSTLLRMMLASHSNLTIPPETWFLRRLVTRLPLERPLRADEIESAVAIITSDYRWPDMKLDAQDFRRAVSQLNQPDLRALVEVVYRWHLHAEGKSRWGDKTPIYIEILPQLAQMYPGSRFIHLVRDGRDVAKSFQATGWVGPWLHDNMREWLKALRYHWRWMGSQYRGHILVVRYEDLVLRMDATLRQICAFIGEEFEPQMLAWEGRVDEQVPAREQVRHTKLKMRIGEEGVDRWKREMSRREIFVCEAFMGSHLGRLGYERHYRGALWEPVFGLTRLYCRTVLPAVEFHIRALRFLGKRLGLVREAG